jgi:hypothetical protein
VPIEQKHPSAGYDRDRTDSDWLTSYQRIVRTGAELMADTLKTLAGILDQIERCRRLAGNVRSTETASKLRQIADELEHYVRSSLAVHAEQDAARMRRQPERLDS